jgi:flagellar hook-basal body complex protein FliE
MSATAFSPIIPPVPVPAVSQPGPALAGSPGVEAGSFQTLLKEAFERVRVTQAEADQELRNLLAGEPVDLHRVVLAGESAALASQLMMAVRNKVVEAYQEIMRIQV